MDETAAPGAGGSGDLGGGSRVMLAWELRGAEAARAATEGRLRGIRAVRTDLEADAQGGLPGIVPGWRSPAAAVYAEQLRGVRAELAGILATVHSAETSAWRELSDWQGECERLTWLLLHTVEAPGG